MAAQDTATRETVHYRRGGSDRWQPVPEGKDAKAWGQEVLESLQGQDTDGWYREYVEFAMPDGTRLYAAAEYDGWSSGGRGGLITGFVFGDAKRCLDVMDVEVERHRFGPERDWLMLPGGSCRDNAAESIRRDVDNHLLMDAAGALAAAAEALARLDPDGEALRRCRKAADRLGAAGYVDGVIDPADSAKERTP